MHAFDTEAHKSGVCGVEARACVFRVCSVLYFAALLI
jgi:hypothetical protein